MIKMNPTENKNVEVIETIEPNTIKKKWNKKIIISIGVAFIVIGGLFGTGVYALEKLEEKQEQQADIVNNNLIQKQASKEGVTLISQEEALQVALETAGLAKEQVKTIEVKLDQKDHGQKKEETTQPTINYYYEVNFDSNGLEYEFDIDAITKEVLKSSTESMMD